MALQALARILGRAREVEARTSTEIEAAYRALVAKVAGGADVDADGVIGNLEKWGRSLSTFEVDCETLAGRIALKAIADGMSADEKRLAEVEARLTKVDAELAAAQGKWETARHPLEESRRVLRQAVQRAVESRLRLIGECPYPERREAVEAARAAVRDAQKHVAYLQTLTPENPTYRQAAERVAEIRDRKVTFWSDSEQFKDWTKIKDAELREAEAVVESWHNDFREAASKLPAAQAAVRKAEAALVAAEAALEAP